MKKVAVSLVVLAIVGGAAFWGFNRFGKNKDTAKGPDATIKQEVDIKQEMQKVKIIITKESDDLNLLVNYAISSGIFKKYNVEVEITQGQSNSTQILMSGGGDLVIGGATRPVTDFLNGAEPRILANLFRPFAFYGVSRFPKAEIGNVKKVAVNAVSGENKVAATFALQSLGADTSKLEFVVAPGNMERMALLEKGDADFAIINSEKFIGENEAVKKYTIFQPQEILATSPLMRTVYTTQNVIETKPEMLNDVVAAIYEAKNELTNNGGSFIDFVKAQNNADDERAKKLFNSFVASQKDIEFIPKAGQFGAALVEEAKKDSNNSDRNLTEIFYDKFAREAVFSVKN